MDVCRISQGGGAQFFLGGGLGKLHAAKRLAARGVATRFLGGSGACSRDNFFKWGNLVRFEGYFHKNFTLK